MKTRLITFDNFNGMTWDELDDALSGAGSDDFKNLIQCAKVIYWLVFLYLHQIYFLTININ